jgi:hypothetical protein
MKLAKIPWYLTGDVVVVLFGCESPIILRPLADSRYIVVGDECYVDELNDASALIGPLSPPWQAHVWTQMSSKRGVYRFLSTATGILHDEDPRLPALSSDWELCPEDKSGRDQGGLRSYKRRSGETVLGDPRLSSEALLQRKVPLQQFILV